MPGYTVVVMENGQPQMRVLDWIGDPKANTWEEIVKAERKAMQDPNVLAIWRHDPDDARIK